MTSSVSVGKSESLRRPDPVEPRRDTRTPAPGALAHGVHLALLDGFELRTGGWCVELPIGSQRLLALLALRSRPVQRVYVAGMLWTDSSEQRSLANLRSTLWRLGRSRCSHLITTRGGLLRLADQVSVDAREAADLARAILERRAEPADGEVERLLEGDLLPDWYDEWLVIERERLRHLRLHALETLCRELSRGGLYWRAIEFGLAAVRADPLRESAHRAVIEAHLAEGNAAEALRHYRDFCARLRAELGLVPSPELQQLVGGLPD